MTREERIRRLQIGLIRSLNADLIQNSFPDDSDEQLLWMFGTHARPLAEALYEVMADLIVEGPRP